VTLEDFQGSLHHAAPPAGLPPLLVALWWDGKGQWSRAHEIAQDDDSSNAAWVHAYLHRKEGDTGNAEYWYRRAQRSPSTLPLEEEWKEIVTALLDVSEEW
jgi:hypothetical protein